MTNSTFDQDHRIPVTLLTGFLGAGKTTLLKNLMPDPAMEGTALLINEFGEVGIDHYLVDTVDETMLVLDSGCICCSVQGDLVKALRNLAARSARREIPPVKRVIIETTGLADPVPVVYTLMQEPFSAARYRCDGVITAVDCCLGAGQLDHYQEAVRQVVMADRLLLTKCDLADEASFLKLNERLDELNPNAVKVQVWEGRAEPDSLRGEGVYTSKGRPADVARWLGAEQERAENRSRTPAILRTPRKAEGLHRHSRGVSSFVISFPDPIIWYGFAVAMGHILEEFGERILRIKGILNVAGDPRPRVVHCVQNVAYPPVSLDGWPEQSAFKDHHGRLVFIAQDLPAEAKAAIEAKLLQSYSAPSGNGLVSCPSSTLCWLSHSMAVNPPVIEVDGWTVHAKRLRRRG